MYEHDFPPGSSRSAAASSGSPRTLGTKQIRIRDREKTPSETFSITMDNNSLIVLSTRRVLERREMFYQGKGFLKRKEYKKRVLEDRRLVESASGVQTKSNNWATSFLLFAHFDKQDSLCEAGDQAFPPQIGNFRDGEGSGEDSLCGRN